MEAERTLWSRLQDAGRVYGTGDKEQSRVAYLAVWQEARAVGDDYHACAAAHMLGVCDPMAAVEREEWHRRALECAARAKGATGPGGAIAGWYASLYSSLGHASRLLGRTDEARRCYERARDHTGVLTDDAYGRSIREGIEQALDDLGPRT